MRPLERIAASFWFMRRPIQPDSVRRPFCVQATPLGTFRRWICFAFCASLRIPKALMRRPFRFDAAECFDFYEGVDDGNARLRRRFGLSPIRAGVRCARLR